MNKLVKAWYKQAATEADFNKLSSIATMKSEHFLLQWLKAGLWCYHRVSDYLKKYNSSMKEKRLDKLNNLFSSDKENSITGANELLSKTDEIANWLTMSNKCIIEKDYFSISKLLETEPEVPRIGYSKDNMFVFIYNENILNNDNSLLKFLHADVASQVFAIKEEILNLLNSDCTLNERAKKYNIENKIFIINNLREMVATVQQKIQEKNLTN